ncbi:MAG: hypothetical protein FWF96_03700 [Kiritimatiellaeota bacterium]|nr:hypothetical protein [Kiritimatiellota bacterium]
MPKPTRDKDILRGLAAEVARIAALPVQEEKRALWRRLNGLKPCRPMVMIDQICWNELLADGTMTCLCEDNECKGYEWGLRALLYQWRNFPVDRVVEPYITVRMAVASSGFGVKADAEYSVSDPTNSVVGQAYHNQFLTDADLDKIKMPVLSHDAAETARRMEVAKEIFDGVIGVRLDGFDPQYMSLWDPISHWMSVEGALMAIVDRPEYVHEMLDRMTRGYLSTIDQAEQMNVLCSPQVNVHCTGAYTDELPAAGHNPAHWRSKDLWCMGLAQMFSTVSPEMYDEFEVPYMARLAERFGLVYYGCCDPMDLKMSCVRKIPKVRKVSMSPWVDQARGAREIGRDYVYSRKPSPALLATDEFHEDQVRADLQETLDVCREHGCPCELILKDISTIRYDPPRLARWAQIAMELVQK